MNDAPLKVLLLGDARSVHLQRLVDAYTNRNLNVVWASLENGDNRAQQLPRRGLIRPMNYLLAAGDVRRIIEREKPDVINAHFASSYGFVAATARRQYNLPIVLHVWGSDILIAPSRSAYSRRKVEGALRSASVVIGDSKYLVGQAAKRVSSIRTEVIPWGVERKHFDLFRVRTNLPAPIRIIMPRPHEDVYNTAFALHGLAVMLRDDIVQLTVPNWGSKLAKFRQVASSLPDRAVSYYDRLSREDFMQMLSEHDVYLSCAQSDSSPASLIEALAIGLIPVVGEIPGVKELVDNKSGYCFDLSNPASLRDTMQVILSGNCDHSVMLRENHERMRRDATFEDNTGRTIALLQEAAGRA